MNATETNDDRESILRNFTLPGKLPIEDLLSKFSGTLEIRFPPSDMGGIHAKLLSRKANGTNGHDGERDHDEENDDGISILAPKTNAKTTTTSTARTNRHDDKNQENTSTTDDQSDCVIISSNVTEFKTPKATSKRPTRRQNNDSTTNASATSKVTPPAGRTSKRKKDEDHAKPGTLGSRQTLTIQTRESKQNLNILCNDLIDTKNMVTSDMFMSLQELCQRAKIKKVPDDPTDLLMKFSLVIPRLSEIDAYVDE